MAYGIGSVVCLLRTILIRITVGPISFLFLELSKFMIVLVVAFWVTVGIFLMLNIAFQWESIMPEAAIRLSAAAAAVVANTSGLMPNDEGKGNADERRNYPFIVDLPKTASSDLETQIKEETLLQMPAKGSILNATTSEIVKEAKIDSNIEERRRSSRPQLSTTTKKNEMDEVLKTEEADE
ncbi:uncharacterized protein LOC105665279 isoform X1 [Ceratitis capitata]|uniref:uncharacterized protein LOC105665279 isoform X1 n=1 Tax=Ceratitis capitata TaxID=7213 RepID=UPI000A10608C|nr:uncharacterized protein LOC105665279 isoform X1 [Ceratitis capitata]